MIISEIGIRNFKSFGNNEQVLKLNTEKGELILLMGKNGSGKSSLIESLDYCIFNKCRGKKRKWVTLSTLPNRTNGELLNRVKFVSNGTEVEVHRGQNPSKLKLIENGIENDRAGKSNINDKIQKYIGLDIETFKSFISMSINDFKNFINLSNEEKKLLLDKLFNLETINILNEILKSLVRDNKKQLDLIDREINTLNESINSIQSSIDKSKEKEQENLESEIEEIKSEMLSKKEEYEDLKVKLEKINKKDKEITDLMESEKNEFIILKQEIKSVDKDIKLYENNQCPMCESDLTTDTHQGIKDSYIQKKEKLLEVQEEFKSKLKDLREKKEKLDSIKSKTDSLYTELRINLRSLKKDLDKLVEKNDNKEESDKIIEFMNTLNEMKSKKEKSEEISSEYKDKQEYHKELSKIFSDSGVKKTIIKNIIDPINHFISENLSYMQMPFEVELDDTFSASIQLLGEDVEHESLSTGETKKINIAIMIAYLKLIRTKRNINILFLDEVFASVDVEGIYSILELLKKFANEYNINIFLVHHSILNAEYFDRIIRINKDIFSNIEELDIG